MKLSKNRINKLLKSKKQTRKKYNKKRKPAPKRKHKNTKNNKKIVNLRTKSLKRKPIRFYKSVESGGANGDGDALIQVNIPVYKNILKKYENIMENTIKDSIKTADNDKKLFENIEDKNIDDLIKVFTDFNEEYYENNEDILKTLTESFKSYKEKIKEINTLHLSVIADLDNLDEEITKKKNAKVNLGINIGKLKSSIKEKLDRYKKIIIKDISPEIVNIFNTMKNNESDKRDKVIYGKYLISLDILQDFATKYTKIIENVEKDVKAINTNIDKPNDENKKILEDLQNNKDPFAGDATITDGDGSSAITDGDGSSIKAAEAPVAPAGNQPAGNQPATKDEIEITTDDDQGDNLNQSISDNNIDGANEVISELDKNKDAFIRQFLSLDGVYKDLELSSKKNDDGYSILDNENFKRKLENFNKILAEINNGILDTNTEDISNKSDNLLLDPSTQKTRIDDSRKKTYEETRRSIIKNAEDISSDPFKDEFELLKSIKNIINYDSLKTTLMKNKRANKAKNNFYNQLFNKKNTPIFVHNVKKILKKYKDIEDYEEIFRTMAGHLYDLNEKRKKDNEDTDESNKKQLAEEEKKQQEYDDDSPAVKQTETGDNTQPAAPTGEPTDETQTSEPASSGETPSTGSDEVDKLEPNLGEKYFIYKDGEGFRLSKTQPDGITSAQLILNTGTVDGDIQYLSIIPDKGFISPDGKEAAMTMATSVAGEENIFATSSLRKEFNNFVAEIKDALAKKDKDFGELKASIEQIIENQQQPAATSNAELAAEPAGEN